MAIAKLILLALVLLLGTLLRFWNLELKPLWMDEIITALFSFGRNYYDVPLDQAATVTAFEQVFTLNPAASCGQIASTVAIQSVHPPLFFCWMHDWLNWLKALPMSWVWQLRALPALFGVVAIAALYQLNRLTISTKAGLIGAAVMAVSPFAVYLSQEARHYTLPMVFVILALSGLYHMLHDLHHHQFRPFVWLGWVVVNSVGCYVHYFFLLAFAAQAVTLIWLGRPTRQATEKQKNQATETWDLERRSKTQNSARLTYWKLKLKTQNSFIYSLIAIALVGLAYLPWVPTLLSHMNRPETDWVKTNGVGMLAAIAPLLQIVSGWSLATIALPLENQPVAVAAVNGCVMAVFAGWLIWRCSAGLAQLWQQPQTRMGTQMLVMFCLVVVGEFLAIAYLLGKDFTQVPRYNFIYFPAVCALIGAGLSQPLPSSKLFSQQVQIQPPITRLTAQLLSQTNRYAIAIVLAIATLSSVLVVSNQVFQKPYNPDQVVKTMLMDGQQPVLVASAYNDFQDVALGLSFALQLAQQTKQEPEPHFAFIAQTQGYGTVWQKLSRLPQPLSFPLNLWVVAPGLKRVGYPAQLTLGSVGDGELGGRDHKCQIAPVHHHRIGIPYQLYNCF